MQSTITLQIQQLEQELVSICSTRIGKRVLLSEKGRAFLSYANDMVQLEAEAIETVSKIPPTGHPAHRHDWIYRQLLSAPASGRIFEKMSAGASGYYHRRDAGII